MKKTMIVLHGSASAWGDVPTIRQWHVERGWADIGYNLVITNGFPTVARWKSKVKDYDWDGRCWPGRDLDEFKHELNELLRTRE